MSDLIRQGLGSPVATWVLGGFTSSDVIIIDEPEVVISDLAVRRYQSPRAMSRASGGLAVRRFDPGPATPRQR